MNEAMFETPPNFDKYFKARTEVEQKEKAGWSEDQLKEALNIPTTATQEQTTPEPSTATPGIYEHENGLILGNDSPAAQRGVLLDQIAVKTHPADTEPTIFKLHKKVENGNSQEEDNATFPGTPYHIRIQTDQKLTSEEVKHLAQLMGYSYRTTIRGESLGEPEQDTPYSFVMFADTTKSRSDDLGMALENFEENYPETVQNGSPIRTTNRAGEGTKGTRLVNPFPKNLNLHFYYAE